MGIEEEDEDQEVVGVDLHERLSTDISSPSLLRWAVTMPTYQSVTAVEQGGSYDTKEAV